MTYDAFLVCSMDPSNDLKHCHNNGWPYLSHDREFAKSLARLPRDKKRRADGLGMDMADV